MFTAINRHLIYTVACFVVISFCSTAISAQPALDLARFQAKYPGNYYITESLTRDVNFKITKTGSAELEYSDYSSVFVLTDNATDLSESREYFNSRFEVKKLEAYSLVPNENTYKKQEVSHFTKARVLSYGVFYDDLCSYIFNFPSVTKGTKLVTESKYVNNDPFYPIVFYFGNRTPVENARLRLMVPENTNISYRLYGYDSSSVELTKTKKGSNTIYEWSSSINKSYIPDGQSPKFKYFTPHILVNIAGYSSKGKYCEVNGSLKDLYGWYYARISQLNRTISPEIKSLTDSMTVNLTTNWDKVACIYRWVQQNIKYVAIEDGDNGFVPREANLVLQRRYGDCKDKSSLLVTMLRSIGLKSGLAWVGTRDLPYKYSEISSISNSNHMIACWWNDENQPMLLDGTTLFHSLGQTPSSIQGKQCIIEKGPDDFVLYKIPVSKPTDNMSTDSVWISINDGSLKGKGVATFTGEKKSDVLASFDDGDSSAYVKRLVRILPKASNKCNYTYASISDFHNVSQPFLVNYNFELPDYITSNSGFVYVNMNVERYLNDFQLKSDRWIPIEQDVPEIHRFVCTLQIPDNIVISSLPEPISFENPHFGFSQQYSRNGNSIMLTSVITSDCLLIEGQEISKYRDMLIALNRAYKKAIVLTTK